MNRISRRNFVFEYSTRNSPCARITPGEVVLVETRWAYGEHDVQEGDRLTELDLAKCDPLTGPIEIEGASPGDTLAVHIVHIEVTGPGGQGIIPGLGILDWENLPVHMFKPRDGRITWLRGLEIAVRPNLGCMGVAPRGDPVPSIWPGDHGGNMDTKYVCARPRILSETRFMTIASGETLEVALRQATADMVDALVEEKGFSRDEAYMLVTIKGDAEICQVVDPLMTARVAMDRDFFESLPPG